MNTQEILECFKRIAKCKPSTQYHVVPCDKLVSLEIKTYPFVVCMNTDESTKPGSHWLGLFVWRKGAELEFFDSYGLPFTIYPKYIREFAEKNDMRILQTREMLQSPVSDQCGAFVISYCLHRMKGCSRGSYYAKFSNNLIKNDKIVQTLIKKLFISNIKCKYFQKCLAFNKNF
nr:TPA_asm: adenain [Orchesella springtail adintovirus]